MASYSYLNNVPACRIHKSNAKEVLQDSEDMIRWYQKKLLALVVSEPRDIKDEDGNTEMWHEYAIRELESIFEDYNEHVVKRFLSHHIIENPDEVEDEYEKDTFGQIQPASIL